MRIIKSINQLRKALDAARRRGITIGFVPTMGYFHEGHLALMRRAKKNNDVCVVSIYVNPKQFSPREDLSRYPRNLRRDASMARKENVDILFCPSDNSIYPNGYLTTIDVTKITQGLCGAFRPGHFKGVATVVAKLLNIVRPRVMYLGAKDAQQAAVLTAMVRDLNLPVKIDTLPTVREKDGLAMSSRNTALSPLHRRQAPVLYRALQEAQKAVKNGERSAAQIAGMIKAMISSQSEGIVQYVQCVDFNTLKPFKRIEGKILIALAVFFAQTRLIDNVVIRVHEPTQSKNQGRYFRLRGDRVTDRPQH